MAGDFRDFVPEGEDNSAYSQGQFRDWVPEGEALPEGMSGNGVQLMTADKLNEMKMPAIREYLESIGATHINTVGVKKTDVVAAILAHQAGNPAGEVPEGEEAEPEDEASAEENTDENVDGLDEEV